MGAVRERREQARPELRVRRRNPCESGSKSFEKLKSKIVPRTRLVPEPEFPVAKAARNAAGFPIWDAPEANKATDLRDRKPRRRARIKLRPRPRIRPEIRLRVALPIRNVRITLGVPAVRSVRTPLGVPAVRGVRTPLGVPAARGVRTPLGVPAARNVRTTRNVSGTGIVRETAIVRGNSTGARGDRVGIRAVGRRNTTVVIVTMVVTIVRRNRPSTRSSSTESKTISAATVRIGRPIGTDVTTIAPVGGRLS